MRHGFFFVIFGLMFVSIASAPNAEAQDVTQLISELQSSNWTVRATAFENLEAIGFSTSDQLKLALINLLTLENGGVVGTPSIPDDGSEDYAEYYGDVISEVVILRDPRSIGALIGAINTGNMAMNAIATFGTSALGQVLQQLASPDPTIRSSAVMTIGKMINLDLVSDQSSQALIQGALNMTLNDSDYYVSLFSATDVRALSPGQTSLSIATQLLNSGVVSVPYVQWLTTNGGTAPYFWSVAGRLPAGLSLDDGTGQISGTPTDQSSSVVTIQVSDSSTPAQDANATFTLNVTSGQLRITTTSLSSGQVGAGYFQALQATGAIPPVIWSTADPLPPGLTLDPATGIISGTPTIAVTNARCLVSVMDATTPVPLTATAAFQLTIASAPAQ
jgi:hypothetical protein